MAHSAKNPGDRWQRNGEPELDTKRPGNEGWDEDEAAPEVLDQGVGSEVVTKRIGSTSAKDKEVDGQHRPVQGQDPDGAPKDEWTRLDWLPSPKGLPREGAVDQEAG